jgi:hypothetical protein
MEEIIKIIKNGVVQYPITKPEAVIDENGVSFDQKIKDIILSTTNIIDVTYNELVTKINESSLVPEQKYKIIDYIFDFTFKSQNLINGYGAGHQFDIIVVAKNTNELYNEARAAKHEGDTYFMNSNLSEWKIWYNIDSGMITRMIDEYGNDCPYDFKNAKFDTSTWVKDLGYCYTFNNSNEDASLVGLIKNVTMSYGSVFDRMFDNYSGSNIFFGSCKDVTCYNSYKNIFLNGVDACYLFDSTSNIFNGWINDTHLLNTASNNFNQILSSVVTDSNRNEFDSIHSSTIHNCARNKFSEQITNNNLISITDKKNITLSPNRDFIGSKLYFINDSSNITPIKYPDLSTQPSVLPHMCMGNYVFEQLFPYEGVNTIECTLEYYKPVILSCDIIGVGIKVNCNVTNYSENILTIEPSKEVQSNEPLFIKLSYTAFENRNPCNPYGDDYSYDYGYSY